VSGRACTAPATGRQRAETAQRRRRADARPQRRRTRPARDLTERQLLTRSARQRPAAYRHRHRHRRWRTRVRETGKRDGHQARLAAFLTRELEACAPVVDRDQAQRELRWARASRGRSPEPVRAKGEELGTAEHAVRGVNGGRVALQPLALKHPVWPPRRTAMIHHRTARPCRRPHLSV
jgi:hypothetical protein